jgi:hypothetical protein
MDLHAANWVHQWDRKHNAFTSAVEISDFDNAIIRLRTASMDYICMILRGKRMEDKKSALQEMGAALQFPYYSGVSYDSAFDCLCDFTWLPQTRIVVCLTDTDHMLVHMGSEAQILLEMLRDAALFMASPHRPDGVDQRLFLVFHSPLSAAWYTLSRLHQAGFVFTDP